MKTLTPAARRALRAKAHHLEPVVSIGQQGLTPGVLHEIEVSLAAHELIKIRVFGDSRTEREALLARICAELGAAAVQHLGKLLIVWRPAPEEPAPAPRSGARNEKSAAKKAPQARRPRSPLPRTPAGPGPYGRPALPGGPGSRRRRVRGTAAAVPIGDANRSRRPASSASASPPPRSRGARTVAAGPRRPAPGSAPEPHGKSRSSSAGASGARRRRKAR